MRKSVDFGADTLDRARVRLGLTNREVWEGLEVSEASWMRWKRTGRVPVERLTDVVLFLDLDEPAGLPADGPRSGWVIRESVHQRIELLEQIVARLERVERQLGLRRDRSE